MNARKKWKVDSAKHLNIVWTEQNFFTDPESVECLILISGDTVSTFNFLNFQHHLTSKYE
jgi:hypothetical protein